MHFAKFRALTKGATDTEKRIADLFRNKDDFKYDFDLSPILMALLGEYDPADNERPNLEVVIGFAKELANAPVGYDWKAQKRRYANRSPLFSEIMGKFRPAGSTKGAKIGILWDLLNGPDALQSWTPLQWAAYMDRKSEFVSLINNGVSFLGHTPSHRNVFHHAAEAGTQDVLAYLLEIGAHEKGVDINEQDRWGETPLHIAAGRSAASVALLLSHGANERTKQEDGQVPLYYTRLLHGKEGKENEQTDCIRHLVRSPNPPINVTDVEGKSPLFHLLKSPECVQILLDKDADTTIVDNAKKSIIHHCCAEDLGETLELLLQNTRENSMDQDNTGDTPLLTAFRHRSLSCAKLLLEHKSATQAVDKNGWTLLHHAVNLGNDEILKLTLALSNTRFWVKTRDTGETAFDISRRMGTSDRSIGEILRNAVGASPQVFEEFSRDQTSSFQLLAMIR
jgi:ankyrin repeat protein